MGGCCKSNRLTTSDTSDIHSAALLSPNGARSLGFFSRHRLKWSHWSSNKSATACLIMSLQQLVIVQLGLVLACSLGAQQQWLGNVHQHKWEVGGLSSNNFCYAKGPWGTLWHCKQFARWGSSINLGTDIRVWTTRCLDINSEPLTLLIFVFVSSFFFVLLIFILFELSNLQPS